MSFFVSEFCPVCCLSTGFYLAGGDVRILSSMIARLIHRPRISNAHDDARRDQDSLTTSPPARVCIACQTPCGPGPQPFLVLPTVDVVTDESNRPVDHHDVNSSLMSTTRRHL